MVGPDYEPRYDYDDKFAAGEDNSVVVEVENKTETIHMKALWFAMEKWWVFRGIHVDIKGNIYLNIVESRKWIGNEIQYSHAERILLPVDDVSQLAVYPREVSMYDWYLELLRPQDQTRSGFSLVANHSWMILDLSNIPADTRLVYDNFACTHIVKTIRRVKSECDFYVCCCSVF